MEYRFSGYVEHVGHRLCWLHMSDQTDPTLPDEMWHVDLTELPSRPVAGDPVEFVIDDNWRGAFSLPKPPPYTAEQIASAKARAERFLRGL